MKKLLLTLFFVMPIYAESQMVPLNKYMEDQNMSDPNVLFYVSARCGAINFNMADLSENRKELYERGSTAGQHYTQMAISVRKVIQPNDSPEENKRLSINSISSIANEYVKVMNDNYAKTGTYFTDWMLEDLSICSALYDMSIQE